MNVTDRATEPNASSIGSICAVWNACDTVNRRVRNCDIRAATASTASGSPAMTVLAGLFTAAISTPSTRNPSTTSREARTAVIAPDVVMSPINAPREVTSRAASGSDMTPARYAAVISPIECPIRTSGRTPNESSSRNRATW
ncbi:hypothetical protein GCM10022255_058710 [Dactylosporangium darangshiense]|uniref:Uncharacterized protein n=1 Tax=Dactylosporangium darangshiense TaxID=579108 RepID=A0ABP8DEZ8_9ACTN